MNTVHAEKEKIVYFQSEDKNVSEFFRSLTVQEGEVYYQVLHEGYQSDRAYPISFSAMDATREEVLKWLLQVPTYGWFQEGRLVSAISLRMPWGPFPGPKKVPHIGHFVTHPDFKHRGYAGKLLHAVEEKVLKEQLKAPSVTLGTAENHPWLEAMYEGFGFHPYASAQLPHKKHKTVYMEKFFLP